MLRALMPVDGSSNSLRAVRHAIKLLQDREPLEIHLLKVERPLHGDVTSFVAKENVRGLPSRGGGEGSGRSLRASARGGDVLHEACLCRAAAQLIAEVARDLRCDKVIMGTHGRGTITQLVMGSVNHEAIHQMDPKIPVTLVKEGYSARLCAHPPSRATSAAPGGRS